MENLLTLTEKNIDDIINVQKLIENKLSTLFKWNELFFTNTKEEFLEVLSNDTNLWKWIYNWDELISYGFIAKDVKLYQWKTLLDFQEDTSAQIDIIAVNPNYWAKWYAKRFLLQLEKEYLQKFKNIKTLLATVSPYNRASLRLFLSNWYFIDGLFKKHNKYYRTILRKDLEN